MKLKKRILSLLLCGAMLFSLCSQSVLAEENGQAGGVTIGTSGLCEHHPEHNADCGYTEGTAGTPCVHEHTADCYEEVTDCVHEHDEDCYPEESVSGNEAAPSGPQKREPTECTHACSEESGCITKELNCQHEHNSECGYSPAAQGTPCGYVCELCGGEDSEKPAAPSNAEAVTVASVQAMIDALPGADEITDDNAEEVKAQLEAIDEAKEKLSDEEIDELDMTRYAEAAAALGALAAPMLLANDSPDEQFSLKPGDTYYFDLSGANIPGTANGSLPDNTLHYVPFTYAGTVDAYKLTSATATTEEYAQQNKYPHSLFVADYAVTHTISWGGLNDEGLIFGKNYASGGVDYTLRAPSVGSNYTGSGNSERGVPQSNECDTMLNKDSGYIQNWNKMYSLGQDAFSGDASRRAVRGYHSARYWGYNYATGSYSILGFRPVLEVLNPGSLGPDGLKAVTLALGGGKLGGSTDTIQIIVKNGSKFTAPASDGLTRPDGNNGSYFKWLGSDGNLYAPGEIVPEVVTTLTAQWTVNQYTITYNLAGGTAEGNPDTYTIETRTFTLKNPTKSGYTFTGWSGTGLDGENNMTVIIPTGSTGNRIYTAHWRYNGSGHSYSYYTIKATAGAGGSISPSGNVSVREGRDQTFTITPDKGYAVANVKIDGKSIGAAKSYTFENVSRTHTIEVIFMKANGNPQTGVFVDVATGSYYEDAVDWAVENGITKGTDDTHFSPDGICTRAQAVTFLWRAAGSPEPETRAMPFADIPVGSYYYDAVLWAVENGITKGTSDTTFSPNMTCTRAQIVAFLWRSEKSPAAGTANPFADVKSTAYYADAVLWAVKENITKGTTNTTFSPDADCTRAQIVTFLYRFTVE